MPSFRCPSCSTVLSVTAPPEPEPAPIVPLRDRVLVTLRERGPHTNPALASVLFGADRPTPVHRERIRRALVALLDDGLVTRERGQFTRHAALWRVAG